MLTLLFKLLLKQKYFEKDKLNHKVKKYIKADFVKDEEDDEDQEINEFDNDIEKIEKYEKKYLKILKNEEEDKLYGDFLDFNIEDEADIDEDLVIISLTYRL